MVVINMKVIVTKGHIADIHTAICSIDNDDNNDNNVVSFKTMEIMIITIFFCQQLSV